MEFGYKMKLGVEFPQKWKDKSKEADILLSDILYGYAIENLMLRINKSSLQESLWLSNESALGEDAYRKASKERLEFLYVEKDKKNASFSSVVIDSFLKDVVSKPEEKDPEVNWRCEVKMLERGAILFLVCDYMDMQVPVTMYIKAIKLEKQIPKEKELKTMFDNKKTYKYFSYSRENVLSEDIFEIMRKLELISDMKAYDQINNTLKTETINGRRVLEELKVMGEKEPKVVSMKRMELISSYTNYAYMKKRWQQYVKKNHKDADEWETVMTRIIAFLGPIWNAFCENDIFFDDWMPELERFLG